MSDQPQHPAPVSSASPSNGPGNGTSNGPGPNPGVGRRGEWLVAIQFALMLGFALLPVWQPGLSAAFLAASAPWRLALALPFGLIALVLAGLGARHLGDALTPLPYPVERSRLVQHGVYAIVRHPLYASLLSLGLAWTLWQLSLSHLLLLGLAFWFFDYKANREERWLTERHPDYPAYAERVPKFVPYLY